MGGCGTSGICPRRCLRSVGGTVIATRDERFITWSQYGLTQVRARQEADVLAFMHDSKGERKPGYLAMVRGLLADGPRGTA